jgi:formate-dependent nitrite reductase cytochrome c552 subunit
MVLFALASAVIAIVALGCGGGNSSTPIAPAAMWQQQGATYVGKVACRDCHSNIYDQYVNEQEMGINDPVASHADDRHRGNTCGACHTTGFGEPTGGKLDGSTPNLDGIGCESCHGPGSKHIAANTTAERKQNITRTPPDKTCMDCHGDRKPTETPGVYRPGALNEPYKEITSADLSATAPGSLRGPHHPAAAFLLGWEGYGIDAPMPSPHSTLPNTCTNCHQKNINPTTGKVDHGEHAQVPNTDTSRPECASCHGGRTGEHLVQDGVKVELIELGGSIDGEPDSNAAGGLLGAYATAHSVKTAPATDPYVIAYKGALWNYKYIFNDGSMGVHNPAFAKRILDDAKALLAEN